MNSANTLFAGLNFSPDSCTAMRALGIVLSGLVINYCSAQSQTPSGITANPHLGARPHLSNRHQNPVWDIHRQLLTRIRGQKVENRDGQFLGVVDDFVLDMTSARLRYVVIGSGGWLGLGKTEKIVPAELFSIATVKQGVASLDVGLRRWKHAPVFKCGDLAQLNKDPDTAEAVNRYYAPSQSTLRRPTVRSIARSHRVAHRAKSHSENIHLEFSSALLGRSIVDTVDRVFGKVSDLLIDFNDRPILVILSPSGFIRSSEKIAMPVFSLSVKDTITLQTAISKETLADAPPLDDNSWRPLNPDESPMIYRYPSEGVGNKNGPSAQNPQQDRARAFPNSVSDLEPRNTTPSPAIASAISTDGTLAAK